MFASVCYSLAATYTNNFLPVFQPTSPYWHLHTAVSHFALNVNDRIETLVGTLHGLHDDVKGTCSSRICGGDFQFWGNLDSLAMARFWRRRGRFGCIILCRDVMLSLLQRTSPERPFIMESHTWVKGYSLFLHKGLVPSQPLGNYLSGCDTSLLAALMAESVMKTTRYKSPYGLTDTMHISKSGPASCAIEVNAKGLNHRLMSKDHARNIRPRSRWVTTRNQFIPQMYRYRCWVSVSFLFFLWLGLWVSALQVLFQPKRSSPWALVLESTGRAREKNGQVVTFYLPDFWPFRLHPLVREHPCELTLRHYLKGFPRGWGLMTVGQSTSVAHSEIWFRNG